MLDNLVLHFRIGYFEFQYNISFVISYFKAIAEVIFCIVILIAWLKHAWK